MLLSTKKGFTLFEVIIATGILGSSLIALLGLVNQCHKMNIKSTALVEQSMFAQSKMAEILLLEDLSSSSSGSGTFNASPFSSYSFEAAEVELPFESEEIVNRKATMIKVSLTVTDTRTPQSVYIITEYTFEKKK